MPVISVKDLRKIYVVGDIQVHALRGVNVDVEAGRVRVRHGPVGVRQVHVHAHPRVPRPADIRRVHPRRPGRLEDVARRPGAGAQPPHRVRVPGLQPARRAPAPSRTWNCRCSTAASTSKRRSATSAPGRRSRSSAWPSGRTTTPTSCRAASSSAWPSRGRSSTTRRSCWPTSRRATSTPGRASKSWTCSSASTSSAASRCCSSRTSTTSPSTARGPSRSATATSCATRSTRTAGWPRTNSPPCRRRKLNGGADTAGVGQAEVAAPSLAAAPAGS